MVTTEVSNKMMLKAMKKRSRVRLIRTKMMKKSKTMQTSFPNSTRSLESKTKCEKVWSCSLHAGQI